VVGIFGNIVSGRITFTVGLAFGLAGLLALTCARPWQRRVGGATAAALAAAASPVAGLFVGLAGTALVLAAWWSPPERPDRVGRGIDGLLVAVAAAVPTIGMGVLFGTGGPMNTIPSDTLRSCTVSLLVAVLVPRPAIRLGALLSAAGVLAASILTTSVGLNAGRLSATFALATLAGYAVAPSRMRLRESLTRPVARVAAFTVLLAGVALWQHPVAVRDLQSVGDPTSSSAYFEPLLAELERRQPVGRVEVVPTRLYREAAYVPGTVPLARGWLRQADIDRNALFFDGRLSEVGYGRWLRASGVSLVALADVPAAPEGRQEARLIRTGLPYMKKVWRGKAWTLYKVVNASALAVGATLVSSTDGGVVVDVTVPGDVTVRVRWSRWLAVRGPAACIAPAPDGWTILRTRAASRYTLTGSLSAGPKC
jgi:hypothetical protein